MLLQKTFLPSTPATRCPYPDAHRCPRPEGEAHHAVFEAARAWVVPRTGDPDDARHPRGGIGRSERVASLAGTHCLLAFSPGETSRQRRSTAGSVERTPLPERERELEAIRLRLLLADDHKIVRESLASRLSAEDDLEVVGQVADGRAAVEEARRLRPDIVLMDISMPVMGGLEATRLIHTHQPSTRVIALSMYERGEMETRMIEAGADRYLCKAEPIERLLCVIRRVGGSGDYG